MENLYTFNISKTDDLKSILLSKGKMFNIIEMLFPVIFILIFIFIFIKGIATWHKNNNSPLLTVSAKIVAKRQNTTHHNQPNAGDI